MWSGAAQARASGPRGPLVEAFVVVAVPGRVGEVRVPADEPEAVKIDGPGFGLGG